MKKSTVIVAAAAIIAVSAAGVAYSVKTSAASQNKHAVQTWIGQKKAALKDKNIEGYRKLIDRSNPEFYHEQEHWFQDFIANPIADYDLSALKVEAVDSKTLLATLEQSYHMNGKPYKLSFTEVLKKTDSGWVDADLQFGRKETPHFVIAYMPGDEAKADQLASIAEQAYGELAQKLWAAPQDRTVLKVYNDKELLRQSVKLSFAWQFSGWYEYTESIKMINNSLSTPDVVKTRIEHEMTHKGTLGAAKNNIPYWFGEGLAEFYSRKELSKDYKPMPIPDLEKIDLEKLTDNQKVSEYYATSAAIVTFMNETYGAEKMKALLNELGKNPYNSKTSGESNAESLAMFHEAVPKALGVDIAKLNEQWLKWVKSKG